MKTTADGTSTGQMPRYFLPLQPVAAQFNNQVILLGTPFTLFLHGRLERVISRRWGPLDRREVGPRKRIRVSHASNRL